MGKTTKMSEYESVQKGSLKFKGVSGGLVKKKKKKKDKERDLAKAIENTKMGEEASSSSSSSVQIDKRTPAELAFQRAQEKRNAQLILEKASKTHKERIMKFNEKLDNLTEHFDIPKVSWTK